MALVSLITTGLSSVGDVGQGGGGGSTTLSGLTDAQITSAVSGDTLRYNGSKWINDKNDRQPINAIANGTGTITLSATSGNVHSITQTGNLTIALASGLPAGRTRLLASILINTSFTLTMPSHGATVKWLNGVTPVSPDAVFNGSTFKYEFVTYDGGTNWIANFIGAY